MKAAIYCRISRDPQGLRAGVERQETECRALVARKGWTVADLYVDNDISAWSGKRRPEYERMLGDVTAGNLNAVVVWHLDRLTRSPKELEGFFETCEAARLKHMATVTGDIDLSNRDGQLQARIMGAVAKKSSDDASARIRAAFEAKAARGEYKHGGVRPFGYEWDENEAKLVIREDEAALIRDAVDRIGAGESRRSITRDWHNRGLLTSAGVPWSITRLGNLLASPRITGKLVHKGEVIGDGNWEPIIDPATQEKIVRRMKRTPVGRRRGRQRHLMTGIIFCEGCGQPMQAKARKNREGVGYRTYRCSNDSAASCGGSSVIAEPVEQIVMWTAWTQSAPNPGEVFKQALDERSTPDPRAQTLRDALAEFAESEKQLTHDHYVDRVVPRDAFIETMAGLRDQRDATERELREMEHGGTEFDFTPQQLAAVYGPPSTLNGAEPEVVELWRAIVGTVFERVDIKSNRGRRFNADRVVLTPRPEFPNAAEPYFAWDLPTMSSEEVAAVAAG